MDGSRVFYYFIFITSKFKNIFKYKFYKKLQFNIVVFYL